ncbi:hypothetical protein [Flavobacterium sp.]|uniref:hypothetical protein n=1 Tax=Flavobacterium sp. TaxID=239 RepID=UPI00286E7679|nr:hypothetical protein [Flavobacterium sp.]
MNLKQDTLNNDKQTAPDCSGSPEVMKVIFSRYRKATAGSSCDDFRKKTLRTRAIAQSWNRHKKNIKKGVQAITGSAEIKAGNWGNYEVSKWYECTPMSLRNEANVKWAAFNVTTGKPVKILEKEIGHFRFQEKAIGQTYLIVAYMFEPELSTGIKVTVVSAEEPKILGIDITDYHDKPITKKLAYGNIINVHVRTAGIVGHHMNITLWEDDVDGAGHSDKNTKIVKYDKPAKVGSKGIAHAQFVMSRDYAKKALKNEGKDDETHEYYVTAFALGELKASKNVNFVYPKERIAETKDKLEGKAKPKEVIPPVKKKIPVQPVGTPRAPAIPRVPHTPAAKKGITSVTLTKKGTEQVITTIYSTGLVGKNIRFKLMEDDGGSLVDDELQNKIFPITGDTFILTTNLKAIPKSWGDDYFEGSEQELFVDIEVLETEAHFESKTINVDSKAFKVDVDDANKVVTLEGSEVAKKSSSCVCKEYDLIWGNKVSCDFRKKVVAIAKGLNLPQENNEGANWLMAVMALETGRSFSPTVGTFKKHKDNSKIGYVGLIQIGKDAATDLKVNRTDLLKLNGVEQLEYVEKFFKQDKFKDKLKTKTDLYLAVNYPNACGKGTEKDYVVYDSSKAAYDDNPMFKREKDESYIDKKGVKRYYEGKKGSSYVWEFEEAINQFYEEGKNHKTPVYSCLIIGKPTNDAKEIITYYIYKAGSIEKSIPKKIKDDFKNKYQYVYIDSKYKTHNLGTFDYTTTKEMNPGNVQGNNNVELLDARQFKGYSKDNIKLKFLTWNSDSDRWYINPDCFAGLLGAMADESIDYLGFNGFSDDLAQSVGGSKSHRNGEKGDLRYLTTNKDGAATLLEDSDFDFVNQNKFNDALYLFGWGRKEKMYSENFKYGKNEKTLLNHTKHMKKLGKGGYRHHHHLHLSGFDHSLILINSK